MNDHHIQRFLASISAFINFFNLVFWLIIGFEGVVVFIICTVAIINSGDVEPVRDGLDQLKRKFDSPMIGRTQALVGSLIFIFTYLVQTAIAYAMHRYSMLFLEFMRANILANSKTQSPTIIHQPPTIQPPPVSSNLLPRKP